MNIVKFFTIVLLSTAGACANVDQQQKKPSELFDLSHWKITLPLDADNNGKVDEIKTKDLVGFSHPDFFYINAKGGLVFQAPNKATTTKNSSNTRSELRQMLRGSNAKIKTKAPKNNFVIQAHPEVEKFAEVGGRLAATLHVNHVAKRAKYADKYPAYSVVVGQIHAGKDKKLMAKNEGFGWGNEPLKIYYKKWPKHEYGSVFWTYERNLAKKDKDRTDIAYPVWGNTWDIKDDPKTKGIALGEEFSYEVNVKGNIMQLSFSSPKHPQVKYEIDLSNQNDAYGKKDSKDHPQGYTGDWMYFKAGAYNQCSTKDMEGFWYAGCPGSGNWETDRANGDYVSVTFSNIELLPAR